MKIRIYLLLFIILPVCFSPTFLTAQQGYPQRMISLGSTLTEELYLLGAQDKLIGVTAYCQRPPEAQRKEKIGTIKEVNLEKIVSLKPDLVLATSLTNPKTIKKLENLGIKVVEFPQPTDFQKLCASFLKLASLVGKDKEAAELVRQANKKVFLIRNNMVRSLSRPKVFVQIGSRPLFTATKETFINDFIEFSNAENIVSQSEGGLYSREQVLRDNPDVIIIATMGIVAQEEKRIWQKYKSLNAVKNGRIYIIDSYKLCGATPLTFADALEEIAGFLHRDE